MSYLEFGMGNISLCRFTFGWAFHHLLKPPFSCFVRVTAWERAISLVIIGYDEFCGGIGHLSDEDQQFFVGSHLSWMLQPLDHTIQMVFQLERRLLCPVAHYGLLIP